MNLLPEAHKVLFKVAKSLEIPVVPVFAVFLHSKTLNPVGMRQIREVKNENVLHHGGSAGER